ncbi:MAG: isoprenylcysteine carboxylmethyltransferase family protein [Alphaproteobacteria bacterium]|nr:isoprenylcysteine carboxylmethyltransferase family protein [Alphaproteobacteria bacterium]
MANDNLIGRAALTVARRGLIQAVMLLAPAGTLMWPKAWVLIAITVLGTGLSFTVLWFRDRGLLRERLSGAFRPEQDSFDRMLLIALIVSFAASLLASSIDVWHIGLFPITSPVVAFIGLAMVLAGSLLWVRAMRVNSFGSIAVKHQADREHAVVDHDVYGIVRHPMYTGILLVLLGQPVWLGSTLGVLVGLLGLIVLAVRVVNEEKFLVEKLDGYDQYINRVRYRLVPGIW